MFIKMHRDDGQIVFSFTEYIRFPFDHSKLYSPVHPEAFWGQILDDIPPLSGSAM